MYGQWCSCRGEVGARGDPDPALPAVRNDQPIAVGGDPADTHRLGESPDPADVGLKHFDPTAVGEVEELEVGVLPLPRGDSDRRPLAEECIAIQIIDVDRRLDEIEIVRSEPLDDGEGRAMRRARHRRRRP